jgi:hypothetical protein
MPSLSETTPVPDENLRPAEITSICIPEPNVGEVPLPKRPPRRKAAIKETDPGPAFELPDYQAALIRLSSYATTLLSCRFAPVFERRLARQIGKIASLPGKLKQQVGVSSKEDSRFHSSIARLQRQLLAALESDLSQRNRRDRLAARLRNGRRKLIKASSPRRDGRSF